MDQMYFEERIFSQQENYALNISFKKYYNVVCIASD